MWVIVLEMWAANEEKLQFSSDRECRHDLAQELAVFGKLRELFMPKLEYASRMVKRKLETVLFERDFAELAKDPELLARLQSKVIKNNPASKEQAKA